MMRWFSLFRAREGWTPMTNNDNHDETGMDDLMHMAAGNYPEDSDSVRPGLEPVFHHRYPTVHNDSSTEYRPLSECRSGMNEPDGRRSCLSFPKVNWLIVLLSFIVSGMYISLNVGLGCYSLLYYKTDKLVIDKSVKSFSIPNHLVYKNFESLMIARRDNSSLSIRSRRSSGSAKLDFFTSLERKHGGFRKKREIDELWNQEFKTRSNIEKSQSSSTLFHRLKRSMEYSMHCLFSYQTIAKWKMHVVYIAHGDDKEKNMFTKERLNTVHEIEKKIIQHPGFRDFCLKDPHLSKFDPAVNKINGCVPLNSLMTYFYPSKDSNGRIFYDGMGNNIDDIDSALKLAMNHETFYYFVDDKINKTYQKSRLIRSEVLFGAPLPGFPCAGDYRKNENDKFKNFVVTYIDLLSKVSTEKVRVLYGGNEIFDYEVTSLFWSDIHMAIISLVAIFLLMLVLSMSPYLTVVGMIVIALSFPISLFFYRNVFKVNALGILNGAAAFVIIGIGVDDVFVFMNIYRQCYHMKNLVSRITHTVKTAGIATFFTSFTTAAAFAANLTSSIPAVYEFGLFMSLIVASCWTSVFILMPPLLYIHACFVEPLERLVFSCCPWVTSGSADEPSRNIEDQQAEQQDVQVYEDDDVPMLNIEQGDDCTVSANQDASLLADDDEDTRGITSEHAVTAESSLLSGNNNNNNMCLGRLMQKTVMFLTNRILIPGRFVVIVLYAAILVSSCFLMTRLKPSTHPPQLFRPDTNIQRLLDLKANFSIIDQLHCDQCSGLYKVRPTKVESKEPKKTIHQWDKDKNNSSSLKKKKKDEKENKGNSDNKHVNKFDLDVDNDSNTTVDESSKTKSSIYHPSLPDDIDWQGNKITYNPLTTGRFLNTPVISKSVSTTPSPVTTTTEYRRHSKDKAATRRPIFSSPTPGKSSSLDENYNSCKDQTCNNLKDRPLMESGATVYVVFGIEGISDDERDSGHVLDQFKGKVDFYDKFSQAFKFTDNIVEATKFDVTKSEDMSLRRHLKELCRVCHILANNTELVKPGSAQCVPKAAYIIQRLMSETPGCEDLPGSLSVYSHQSPAHAEAGFIKRGNDVSVLWLAFAFESTTSEGQAYFQAYKQFEKWETAIDNIKSNVLSHDSPLRSVFQTSKFWTKVMMEVVAVNSAIYGLVLSMLICVVAVAIFTGHLVLLFIVVLTIIVMICCVVGIFYLAGWEMGAVEAVSLSILVGSSVDYCVHIVEGYILAGRYLPDSLLKLKNAKELRQERTSLAVRHIGVAILCSALTTIIAAIPLTQTFIQPFAKFGSILLINTTVSMIMTLTLAVPLLATFGPARFKGRLLSHVLAAVGVLSVIGLLFLSLYIASLCGVEIPGPSGQPLFG